MLTPDQKQLFRIFMLMGVIFLLGYAPRLHLSACSTGYAFFAWFCRLIYDPINVITTVIAGFTIMLFLVGRDTAQRQLRAYLWARPDTSHRINFDELHTQGFKFIIANDGQTPAYGVRHVIRIGIYESQFEVEETAFPQSGSKFVLNPNAHSEMAITKDLPLSAEERKAIESEESSIYISGEIRYVDAFKYPRWTKFRMKFTGRRLIWCDEGNDAT